MKFKPSPNFDQRKDGKIKYLILHYTGMATGAEAIERLCDRDAAVSAHYVVEENGEIYSLVNEDKRAWHAGVSKWENDLDINDLSIGIEIVNSGHPYPGYESVYRPFLPVQMDSVLELTTGIVARHNISPCYVLGHSDVAWRRKIDPGELFDWSLFAKHNIGLWPDNIDLNKDIELSEDKFLSNLSEFGYDFDEAGDELKELIVAFQRHFRQGNIDGVLDHETFFILDWLVEQKANLQQVSSH